ncbi:MAG: phosphotransferase [Candidatus Omnitrophica bacterium]|nr:phosphotransferase [Candidatus Omnitrophota bacterium]
MIESIRRLLFKETYKKGIDPKDLHFVKRSGGDFSSEGRALFEIFSPRSEDPIWIVKANRSKAGNEKSAAEFERLKKMRKGISEDLRDSLPAALVLEERPTGSISIETFLPGTKVSLFFQEGDRKMIWRNWHSYGSAAIRWLERYSEVETPFEIHLNREWFERVALAPLENLASVWVDVQPEASSLIDRIRATSIDFDIPLKTVPQHGDYTPGNLIAMEGRLGVIDWSPVDLSNPPLMDLFHFLLSSSIYFGKGLEKKPWEVLTDSRFLEGVQSELRALFLQTGVPVEARIPLFRAAFLKKIEGYLSKPQAVESSVRQWTRLFGDDKAEVIEEAIVSL